MACWVLAEPLHRRTAVGRQPRLPPMGLSCSGAVLRLDGGLVQLLVVACAAFAAAAGGG